RPLWSTLFPYTTLFRSNLGEAAFEGVRQLRRHGGAGDGAARVHRPLQGPAEVVADVLELGDVDLGRRFAEQFQLDADEVRQLVLDRKSTRLNSSHVKIS